MVTLRILGLNNPKEIAWYTVLIALAILIGVNGALGSPLLLVGMVIGGWIVLFGISHPRMLAWILLFFSWLPLGSLERKGISLGGLDPSASRLALTILCFTLVIVLKRLTLPKVFTVYLLFLAYSAFSVAFSLDKLEGIRTVFKLAYPLLLSIIVYHSIHSKKDIHRVLKILAYSGILGFLFNFVLLLNPGGAFSSDVQEYSIARFYGWAGWGAYAYFSGLLALLFISLFVLRHRKRDWWTGAFFTVQSLATLLRISFAALFLSLLFIDYRTKRGWRAPLILILSFVIFINTPLFDRMWYRPIEPKDLFTHDIAFTLSNLNLRGRDLFWRVALKNINSGNVIQGTGLGTYAALIEREVGFRWQAHGEYFKLALELGIIGLGLLILTYIFIWREMHRLYHQGEKPLTKGLALAGAAGLMFYSVTSITGNTFGYYAELGGPFFTILVLAARAAQLERFQSEHLWQERCGDLSSGS